MMDTEVEEQNSMNNLVSNAFAVGSEANDNIIPAP